MSSRTLQVIWMIGIIAWVLICSVSWFIATRDDYAKLNAASACYDIANEKRLSSPQCATVKQSDIYSYKAEIDRKARISRVVAALGSGAAIAVWLLLGRPGLTIGSRH